MVKDQQYALIGSRMFSYVLEGFEIVYRFPDGLNIW